MTTNRDPEFVERLVTAQVPYEVYDYVYETVTHANGRRYQSPKRDANGDMIKINQRTEYFTIDDVGWSEFLEVADNDGGVDIPGIGNVSVLTQYGGEGKGDEYWFVLKITDGGSVRYFRMDGYYASYDGGHYDGNLYEVKPVERTVTFYE